MLAVLWVAVLAPSFVRGRMSGRGRGRSSISSFRSQLDTLERTGGSTRKGASRPSVVVQSRAVAPMRASTHHAAPGGGPAPARRQPNPRSRYAQAQARRRRVLAVLLAAVPVTAAAALMFGGWFILAQLAADALLGGFVFLLLQAKQAAAEREMKVAFLPHRNPGAEPTRLLEQSLHG
ncbi:MAG: hypothetical protein S0880_35920 [Actinomycetota bacterium]|nr:hypothetical protein [Actinomycetota bacterium]